MEKKKGGGGGGGQFALKKFLNEDNKDYVD